MPRLAALLAALLLTATAAQAAGSTADPMLKQAPRKAEVNGRLANQGSRIAKEHASGQISTAQAKKLHHEDKAIHREAKAMAAKHGGHLSKPRQAKLNRQENRVSRQIAAAPAAN